MLPFYYECLALIFIYIKFMSMKSKNHMSNRNNIWTRVALLYSHTLQSVKIKSVIFRSCRKLLLGLLQTLWKKNLCQFFLHFTLKCSVKVKCTYSKTCGCFSGIKRAWFITKMCQNQSFSSIETGSGGPKIGPSGWAGIIDTQPIAIPHINMHYVMIVNIFRWVLPYDADIYNFVSILLPDCAVNTIFLSGKYSLVNILFHFYQHSYFHVALSCFW